MSLDRLIFAQLFKGTCYPFLLCYLIYVLLVWYYDTHAVVLQGISVNEALCNSFGSQVDLLYSLWSYLLALLEFEDVLFSIDNLQ